MSSSTFGQLVGCSLGFRTHRGLSNSYRKNCSKVHFHIAEENMSAPQGDMKYIYEMSLSVWSKLCKILNQDNKWEELAGDWMGYNNSDVQQLRNEENPADKLLIMWGKHNHLITELFILLSQMHYYPAMEPLLPLVESKYHPLFCNSKIVNQLPDESNHENKITSYSDYSNKLLATIPALFSTSLPQISYSELIAAIASNWRKESLLGRGGFGTVFKGIFKNTEVAIKMIHPRPGDDHSSRLEELFHEIKILNSYPHENILPLYGYSIDGEAPCLLYQFMINGSLKDRLEMKNGTPPLNWLKRLEIAKGTARGLQYLHTVHTKPLIHGDIKSANILLDKNLEPRIGDFGLAKEVGSSEDFEIVNRIQGTKPYLPEEYMSDGILSTKVDTYSYGIVLFELATGLPAEDKCRQTNKLLKDYVDSFERKGSLLSMRDPRAGNKHDEVFEYLMSLGKWCSNKLKEHRPEMTIVFEKFKT